MGPLPELSSKEPTANQIKVKTRFTAAAEYAKRAMTDPVYRAEYNERGAGMRTGYNVAIADFFKAPIVTEIDVSKYRGHAGDPIRVIAVDDFRVKNVTVSIRDENNTELEFGECIQLENGNAWIYTVASEHLPTEGQQVKAIAYDIPENKGEMLSPVE